ncbi:Protein SINE2 [Hirschfeldia incana]|nr:Protein SINE2 [Hirschfeldia incana]
MGRNLGSAFGKELASLDKDPDTYQSAISNLRTIVKDLDARVIHVFLAQVSEVKEIGSESGGGYTVSLFEDLARSHGVKIAPHVETIMPVIIRTLSSCDGSLIVQQACSKAVAAIARYGIDPAMHEDKKRNVVHSLCKPLSDSLLDPQHEQHLALGSALCLKSLVDCDNWRYASGEMVNSVCQSLAVALEATSSEAESHMALVIALAKRNAFIVEAYARLLVKSGLRILELGVVEGDSQKRVLAVQMLNFLMKYLNPKSISSEVELVLQEMRKHLDDEIYFVREAVHATMSTANILIKEADPMKCTPSLRAAHNRSYVNDQENDDVSGSHLLTCADYNQETGSRNQIQFTGGEDDNMESICFHQRKRSSEFNESVCSRTSRPRSSRRNRKKRRSERNRHGFTQDSFTVLLENREQLRQSSESSSSSPIHERSGTTTPTEDIFEKPKIDLDSEAKVKTEETVTESRRDNSSKKSVMRWGLSFFSVVVAGLASFMWVHLQDDMMMPHLVPT